MSGEDVISRLGGDPDEGRIYSVLSPMAGVTDMTFRTLCHENGADLVVTEMVSAKAVTYKNKNTYALCRLSDTEHPVSLQLFGSEPETIAEAIRILSDKVPFDMIDINMGCPMPKIVNNGEGSALMKEPVLAGKIVEAASHATDKPVTAKIRSGFDLFHVNAPELAHILAESGASMITVHGRTREQYYEGKADWDVIAKVRRAVCSDVKIIGNGDVTGIESAREMLRITGCDGVAIGRAARGNPWIFKELSDGKEYMPTVAEKRDMIFRHLEMIIADKGEYIGVREMRKQIGWYTAGLPGSAKLRVRVNQAKTLNDMRELVAEAMI